MNEAMNNLNSASGTRYVVVDLEATTCDRQPGAGHEIIEIGAVGYEVGSGEMGDFQTFVRPTAEPVLSEFCMRLTSIRQDQVDRAPKFPQAYEAFRTWRQSLGDTIFASWGNYDVKQIQSDCALHNIDHHIGPHVNLKKLFGSMIGRRPMGMEEALGFLGIPLLGKHHRGIDDAHNITRILERMLNVVRGKLETEGEV